MLFKDDIDEFNFKELNPLINIEYQHINGKIKDKKYLSFHFKRIFEDDHGTGDVREPLKVLAWNIIRHNYWLGVGFNNYTSVIHKYDNTPEGVSWHFPAAVHNEYLLIAAELGVPAAVVFFFLMGTVFMTHISLGLSRADPVFPYLGIGFFCGWIGWCFHHTVLYEYIFFSHNIWFYLGIIQALRNISEK